MDAVTFLIALKKALPHIGRTDTKILVALAGMDSGASYDKLCKLTGSGPFQCIQVLEQTGFVRHTESPEVFLLNDHSLWKPLEVKKIRVAINAEQEKNRLLKITEQSQKRMGKPQKKTPTAVRAKEPA